MTLATIVLFVLALFAVQIFLQETSRFGFDLRAIVGNRDHPPQMSIVAGRLERAKNNMLEALPVFVALAALAMAKGNGAGEATHGALIFVIARAVYVAAYVSGVPMLRSVVWLAANAGLVMMALAQV
jgi:uncharacterized MAPEG superfamily protein